MKRAALTVFALGILGSVASAAPRATYRWTDPSRIGATFQAPPPDNVSHIIFLDNCQPNGCTLTPGSDGTQNQSDIVQGQSLVSAYQGSSSQWQQIVQCVQQTYAPFGVQIVTTRPGSGAYHHAIVAGHAADVGEPQGVLGVSPFNCGYIPNSISFSFANEEVSNIYDICWTVAQETSHSWGLDHKFDNRDPMTYLGTGPQWKQFQNMAGSCGEYSARQCNCTYPTTGNAQENAYAVILATFGSSAPDTTPPTVKITAPTANASVMPGFQVVATVTDDIAVAKAELTIDGVSAGALTSSPFQWNSPTSLGQGTHHLVVTGTDLGGNTAMDSVDVMIGTSCTSGGCTDPMQVCIDGHCVAGPGNPGGLGTTCTMNSDCASGQCADDGMGHKYCVAPCDPTKNQCPSGFGCVAAGTGGVCWPGADSGGGGGGGCNTGSDGGVILLSLGFAAVLITRKRR